MKTLQIKESIDNKRELYSPEFFLLKQDIQKLNSKISKLENLLSYQSRKVKVTLNGNIEFIPISEITHCEADGNYCRIFVSNGSKIVISKTLKFMESRINHSSFLRIHQSFLINKNYIKSLHIHGTKNIIMSDDLRLPISRRFNIKTIFQNTL